MMMISKCHVACNIYLSAGLPIYRNVLERLLVDAQQQQPKLQHGLVIHAFADTQYDRTSFHLAGSPWAIVSLATSITSNAMQVLAPLKLQREQQSSDTSTSSPKRQQQQQQQQQQYLEHPTVGIVDHISILPIGDTCEKVTRDDWLEYYNKSAEHREKNNTSLLPKSDELLSVSLPTTTVPSGWVAWTIGWNLLHRENMPVDVLYYGHAHPTEKPLAEVRREKTNFFRSPPATASSNDDIGNSSSDGGNDATGQTPKAPTMSPPIPPSMGQCTIGAPPHFVENYNLRLTTKCSKTLARSLTRAVREKDGGLPSVEALTLPYGSQDRFEVACNLLNPKDSTSSQDVDVQVARFWKEQNLDPKEYLEVAYRVGTTEQQCLQVLLENCQSREELERHDESVRVRFLACFQSDDDS
ncbi:unnamed protein product [Cylindrotheca closterium]|uniref:Uncharacterized protein n=1 Tax=Cylindrotheca closterium TaxID=2856 RepID=A0AAD2FMY6_9STRA|nr:unnamed protein product [Cylindrotheca closterium]